MNRRHFIALSGAAGMAAVTSPGQAAEDSSASGRDYYELRRFILEKEEQRKGLDAFLKEAAIPALNRMGIKPVGVFYPSEGLSPVYMLLTHPSLESVATMMSRMGQDTEFTSKGAEFLNAPASAPAYKRVETSLLVAFKGMPRIETPAQNPGRVFQLRIYESPSVKTNLKKIEMFNDAGEIKIFREVGLNPVFFGQALIGDKMPNLTYMLGFKNMDEQKAAWQKFGAHPEWKRLSKMPEYADKTILSNITNLPLVAAEYSQV
jgi:NIPSNAP protein